MNDIADIVDGCRQWKRGSQEELYRQFYGYAMAICLRYANHKEEAVEILNDGFLKVFTHISTYDTSRPFKSWLARIMANTAIDHLRAQKRLLFAEDINKVYDLGSGSDDAIDKLSVDELLTLVQELPPAYKMVFNLYVMEGFQHQQIASMLGISEGTSKSNLFKAKRILKEKIERAASFLKNDNDDLPAQVAKVKK
ncbi:sigma-70 family RNA polymerase sigma factor [Chitinophaga horti]|uniref:Sigma-70 family RNA polymerase sigma factor n=1 Tax=Chitinophaga horti TaxID=2920382 RepID=A0ABY6J2I1_9BACT|nr:sigma-70 family RNA polymerase sigma factor [Chitinophaga horti]UYQ92857.1 sigma-70 family RNA polymerase sigma factor [Chitinophaga horti]